MTKKNAKIHKLEWKYPKGERALNAADKLNIPELSILIIYYYNMSQFAFFYFADKIFFVIVI